MPDSRVALRPRVERGRAGPARPALDSVPGAARVALPALDLVDPTGEEDAPRDAGSAGPADCEVRLVHDRAVRAGPGEALESGEAARATPPVEPAERRAAEEQEEECGGQEVVHVGIDAVREPI